MTSQQLRSEILGQDRLAEEDSNPGALGRILMGILEVLHIGSIFSMSTDSATQEDHQHDMQETQSRQEEQERQD